MLLQNPIKKSKSEIHLELELTILGFTQSLKALKLFERRKGITPRFRFKIVRYKSKEI